MLTREELTRERVDMLIEEARKQGRFDALTHEERDESRHNFLQQSPISEEGLWVFGYGSLLWNPAFHYIESVPARLYGYRRHYCLHLTMGRGSPEKPGIMLALDTGGSCNGRAFLIEPAKIDSETEILWLREMISGAYLPRWVKMKTEDGKSIEGLTFVVNRDHSRYRDHLSDEDLVQRICQGEGHLGSSREYLENTVAHLEEIGVRDQYLHRLLAKVKTRD
ncbi:gamma-glutamylcyclotransferase [Sneathiella limimaris]|uniref:gamma-glutamylcyclotransferase n=1 Tax=Sneathiella limimaris TaxID=1964213 RepID=UPI00146CDCFE|nr:gamma-glutamylcyclotransferase [Sneathiella limimaris]